MTGHTEHGKPSEKAHKVLNSVRQPVPLLHVVNTLVRTTGTVIKTTNFLFQAFPPTIFMDYAQATEESACRPGLEKYTYGQ